MPSRVTNFCKCGCGEKPSSVYAEYIRSHRPLIPIETRFWQKVYKHGPIPNHRPELGHCWTWKGAHSKNGYCMLNAVANLEGAHRISYRIHKGEIPINLELDHLCRNRGCVNPDHLEPVTRGINVHRGYLARPRLTHCAHGHELSGGNLFTETGTRRQRCRTCKNEINRRWRQAHATR